MNEFERDDAWQREMRDRILAPGFYGRYAKEGRYVFIDKGKLASSLQKRYAVDTMLQGRDGSALCIEEKIVRWPGYRYAAFCLETKSCTVPGHESPGWMFYGQADFLLYCFETESGELDCWLIDFPKLQRWFWPLESSFPTFQMRNTLNKTAGRKVPIADVHRSVPTWRKRIPENVVKAPAMILLAQGARHNHVDRADDSRAAGDVGGRKNLRGMCEADWSQIWNLSHSQRHYRQGASTWPSGPRAIAAAHG